MGVLRNWTKTKSSLLMYPTVNFSCTNHRPCCSGWWFRSPWWKQCTKNSFHPNGFKRCNKVIKANDFFPLYPFYALMKGQIVWQPHGGMHGAHCPKDTNQKASTYWSLKKEPLNFQHSSHFLAKAELSKCHPVEMYSRGNQLWNMNEARFKDKSTHFAPTLKGKVCNLRSTMTVKEEGVGRASAEVFLVLVFLCHVWPASSHAANRVSINIPSLGLSGHCKSLMPHLFLVLSAVGITTGGRKWVKLGYEPFTLLSSCCPFFLRSTDVMHYTWWKTVFSIDQITACMCLNVFSSLPKEYFQN